MNGLAKAKQLDLFLTLQICLSTRTIPSARLKEAPDGQTSTQGGSAQGWHIIGNDSVDVVLG